MRAAKRRWTASEQQLLEEMLAADKSAAQIGLELNRNAEAVYARVQRLRLKSKSSQDELSGLSFSRRSAAQTMADFLSLE
jgi:IS30 family transposase